ncbi:MAG: hypothetical protein Q4A32_09165 [Lachnospiraceae bacterium]|nr:hypothetical protein [Lachnospiraceae bacterium]
MAKSRINLSLDPDTKERLKMYAWENHASVSKAVTDLVWAAKVKNSQVRGQTSLDIREKRNREKEGPQRHSS